MKNLLKNKLHKKNINTSMKNYPKKIIFQVIAIILNFFKKILFLIKSANQKIITIKILKKIQNIFYLLIKISNKIIKLTNAPLFYLEKSGLEKFSDCKLLAKVLYNQPPNSDRHLEYPWMLENIKITNGKILDVGSTASDMLYKYLPTTVEIYSIDLNNKHINNNSVKFSVGDIRKTDYNNNFFDIISCISTLEHIGVSGRYRSDEDIEGDSKAVKEMKRILKPGGTILITVPYGIKDVLPINKLYNKERIQKLFENFSSIEIEYKKYFNKFNLWLNTNEIEASKTDMLKDRWYAIAFIKVKK